MVNIVQRHYWLRQIEQAWKEHSVIWLSGVRRTGKTSLSNSLPQVEYFDCELPRVRRMMEDPEAFLAKLNKKRVVLDEIHRLRNPSELLKIAADHYPETFILATGSSTLSASKKFKDTLTGRKVPLWLSPMMDQELKDFGNENISHRFIRGGLPPFFLSEGFPERKFQEWMDDYWSKDIQELFRLERRDSFLRFVELLLAKSGGIFEATSYAGECEVNRQTIINYLNILEATLIAYRIRPFSTHRPTEIVSAPKVYGFDTGFVCYYRGWHELRKDDMGLLWEHYVLNELYAHRQQRDINYWRDKQGHELDFILKKRGENRVDVIECKWSTSQFDPGNLLIFRKIYPEGKNYIVAHDCERAFDRTYGDINVSAVSLKELTSLTQP